MSQEVAEWGIFCHKHNIENRSYDVDNDEIANDRRSGSDVQSGAWFQNWMLLPI